MKLIKFRIRNYKSIRDTGDCRLASDLTILAGKNEAGKTAILEALRDFDTDAQIPEAALPLDDSYQPSLALCFEIDEGTLEQILQQSGATLGTETKKHILENGLTLQKDYEDHYHLDPVLLDLLNRNEETQEHINNIQSLLHKLRKEEELSAAHEPSFDDDIETIQAGVQHFISHVIAAIPSIADEQVRQRTTELVHSLDKECQALNNDRLAQKFCDQATSHIPRFILFSDFEDILPFEIPFTEIESNEAVQDFAEVAKLDIAKVIATTDKQRRGNQLRACSVGITGDFGAYWTQGKIELMAEADGDSLLFGVQEADGTLRFKVEQRSKGFQWFLSFYLRLNARRAATNIILIDEPGLYLHAKAQRDVLKVLEKLSKESQVVFGTHSPCLIDADRLDRVRLVLKDDKTGTRIESKIHKGADQETLTPVITAIGLDIGRDLRVAAEDNVLLEGISDYYYLQAMGEYVSKPEPYEANLIPCVGASKIPQLVSLLLGWDLEFVVVLDNDREGRKTAKELSEKLGVGSERIIFVLALEKGDHSIEDLFTHEDFNSFVLEDVKNDDSTVANSKFLKKEKLDKVLLAKQFSDKVRTDRSEIKLSQQTINAFEEVFRKIAEGFTDPDIDNA